MPTAAYKVAGDRVPGVTTILSRFKDSGGLIYWACQQGQAHPDMPPREALYGEGAAASRAANIGTLAHQMVEFEVNDSDPSPALEGVPADMQEKARNAFQQFLDWRAQTRLELLSGYQEISLVCPRRRFGGTPDAIGRLDGRLVLLDWKTSNAVYSDYVLQLAAYGHLVEHGVRLDTGEPLGLGPVEDFRLLRFSKDWPDFEDRRFGDVSLEREQFFALAECYHRDKQIAKRVR